MLEPICSPLSRLLLFFRPPPFVPSFFGQRRNLCYLLVTFIWSPRVLDLSRYSLSLSPSLQLSPFTLPRPFQLTITYQQPAASNSPELLIPDFRPVGETLSYFLFFSPPISSYFSPPSFLLLLPLLSPLLLSLPSTFLGIQHLLSPLSAGSLISRATLD